MHLWFGSQLWSWIQRHCEQKAWRVSGFQAVAGSAAVNVLDQCLCFGSQDFNEVLMGMSIGESADVPEGLQLGQLLCSSVKIKPDQQGCQVAHPQVNCSSDCRPLADCVQLDDQLNCRGWVLASCKAVNSKLATVSPL